MMTSFNDDMTKFLRTNRKLSFQDLISEFGENSFAIIFLLLMFLPALPIPTGGITHVFEIIVALVALELIVGRRSIWLPKRWLIKELPKSLRSTALPKLMSLIGWVENRFGKNQEFNPSRILLRLTGVAVFLFTVFAFLAPPFSGLDTLPAMGVVALSLSMVFKSRLLTVIGIALGSIGIILILVLGRVILTAF